MDPSGWRKWPSQKSWNCQAQTDNPVHGKSLAGQLRVERRELEDQGDEASPAWGEGLRIADVTRYLNSLKGPWRR